MPKQSAGLLLIRESEGQLEVLLVHPGGPFWAKRDDGAWSIPKGEFSGDEDMLQAAKREFNEETGVTPIGDFTALDPVRQPSGKIVYAWALKADLDPSKVKSNTFQMDWPPGSGLQQEFPEIDRAEWFSVPVAREKINLAQAELLDRLGKILGAHDEPL